MIGSLSVRRNADVITGQLEEGRLPGKLRSKWGQQIGPSNWHEVRGTTNSNHCRLLPNEQNGSMQRRFWRVGGSR